MEGNVETKRKVTLVILVIHNFVEMALQIATTCHLAMSAASFGVVKREMMEGRQEAAEDDHRT